METQISRNCAQETRERLTITEIYRDYDANYTVLVIFASKRLQQNTAFAIPRRASREMYVAQTLKRIRNSAQLEWRNVDIAGREREGEKESETRAG